MDGERVRSPALSRAARAAARWTGWPGWTRWSGPAESPGLGALLAGAADFLLPPACAGCGGSAATEARRRGDGPVCQNCRLGLVAVPEPTCERCGAPLGTGNAPSCLECAEWPDGIDSARAACLLQSPARELVHALKYHGWRSVGTVMARAMARRASPGHRAADCIVPVPTSDGNRRRRGYNQAEVVARALAEELGVPLVDCLERARQRGTQTALNPAQRRANVSGAFCMTEARGAAIRGLRVLLVDDVITTGATLLAATEALRSGGPRAVQAYAFARTVPISTQPN